MGCNLDTASCKLLWTAFNSSTLLMVIWGIIHICYLPESPNAIQWLDWKEPHLLAVTQSETSAKNLLDLDSIFQMKGKIKSDPGYQFLDCYPMTKQIRGQVLILNDFGGRKGSDLDVQNLENLFQQLNFCVVSSFFVIFNNSETLVDKWIIILLFKWKGHK